MIDILDIPAILRRHIIWLIAFPILFAALAVVFLALKTPQYRTSAELIIQPESVQVIQNDPAGTVANQSLQGMDLLSQAYIILSSPVLNQVANNLNLDDSPTFKRPGLLRRLLGSTTTNTRSSSEAREETLAILRDILEVVRLNQSLVFLIQVTHPDAQLAAAIANETATAYIEQIQSSRAESLGRASTSLTKQASQLRTRVDQAEAAIEAYKASQGLISTSGGSIVDQQIESLNTQITEARVELERAKATNERIAPLTLVDVESGALPQSASDSVLNSLRVQYARAAQQEAEAATTLGANHPTLLELRSQVNNTKRQIQDELQRIKTNVRSQYEQAQATLDALERQSEYLQSQNTTQGQALIELRQLQSDADASRAVYDAFLKRARELEELPELDTNSSRILSTATVPSSPNGPRGSVVLAAAMVFGFMTAAAGILGLAILKGPVASERQLVAETGIPILAKLNETGDRSGSFRPLKGLFGGRTSNSSLQGIAQTRVAYAIRQSLPDNRSANILVLSIGETGDTFKFTRKVAEELHEMGQEVLFAHTTGHEQPVRPTPALSENGNPGLLNRLTAKLSGGAGGASGSSENQDRQTDLPGHSGLSKYLQVEQINPRRKYASSGDLNTANEAFLLVDAGNIDKSPLLPVLLRHCDTIILITALDGISMQDCKRTLAYLEPWQDRIIGNVVL